MGWSMLRRPRGRASRFLRTAHDGHPKLSSRFGRHGRQAWRCRSRCGERAAEVFVDQLAASRIPSIRTIRAELSASAGLDAQAVFDQPDAVVPRDLRRLLASYVDGRCLDFACWARAG
jgi:hypothetical protein